MPRLELPFKRQGKQNKLKFNPVRCGLDGDEDDDDDDHHGDSILMMIIIMYGDDTDVNK